MSSGRCHGSAPSRPMTPFADWAQIEPDHTATGALMAGMVVVAESAKCSKV